MIAFTDVHYRTVGDANLTAAVESRDRATQMARAQGQHHGQRTRPERERRIHDPPQGKLAGERSAAERMVQQQRAATPTPRSRPSST